MLVVVGFGVAKFLGQPVLLPESLRSYGTQAQTVAVAAPTVQATTNGSHASNSVRLLPDTSMTQADRVATNAASAMPQAPALGGVLAPILAANDSATVCDTPRMFDFAPIVSSPIR